MHLKPKLIAVLLLCNCLLAHSQDRDFLLQKAKKQKKAGVIMLSAGGATALVGTILVFANADKELVNVFTEDKNDAGFVIGTMMLLTGSASVIGSIPLFIASSKNYKKADARVSLDFRNLRVPGFQQQTMITYPALSVKWSL
jgi:hypothetical protein